MTFSTRYLVSSLVLFAASSITMQAADQGAFVATGSEQAITLVPVERQQSRVLYRSEPMAVGEHHALRLVAQIQRTPPFQANETFTVTWFAHIGDDKIPYLIEKFTSGSLDQTAIYLEAPVTSPIMSFQINYLGDAEKLMLTHGVYTPVD